MVSSRSTPPAPLPVEASQKKASGEKAELIAAPVLVDGEPDAHTLKLKIGVQQFRIGDYFDTREEAEWMAGQLRHALTAIRFDALRVAGISELKAEISRLTAERDALKAEAEALRKALDYAVKQVPGLATVPGIAAAIAAVGREVQG